jgi:CheY-like chemotaxis protein
MTGWDVLRTLRSEGPNRHVPAVVMTVVGEKGVGAGFAIDDFLVKPVRAEDLLAALDRAGVPPNKDGTVLVVDGDPATLKLIARALRQRGYRPICEQDGESGLRAAAREHPAAVVLDLLMPGMDGFEFLRRFHHTGTGRRTPVIVWTMKELTPKERARLRATAQGVVVKGEGSTVALLAQIQACVSSPARPEVPRAG